MCCHGVPHRYFRSVASVYTKSTSSYVINLLLTITYSITIQQKAKTLLPNSNNVHNLDPKKP
ncbi:hypothetical protein C0W81_13815 [Photobacterium aquimaris]|uniref:Uncharacterized protein n=1 Tax=Photobacterium aquimaris TaxID=512643 RepID=A0A2T3HVT1_9GAMM|nr:hypothetical protein C0W81_13815 [Photobacterium aquimaris]